MWRFIFLEKMLKLPQRSRISGKIHSRELMISYSPKIVTVVAVRQNRKRRNHSRNSRFSCKRFRLNRLRRARQQINLTRLDNCPSPIKAVYCAEEKIDGEWIHWPLVPINSPIYWSVNSERQITAQSIEELLGLIKFHDSDGDWNDCPF